MTVYREPGVRPVYEDPPPPKPKKTFQPRTGMERQAKLLTFIWGTITLMTLFVLVSETFGAPGFRWLTLLRLTSNLIFVSLYAYIWRKAYRPVEE